MNLFHFFPGYSSAIFETGREPAFVLLVSFVTTFIFIRTYTRLARKRGWNSASINGVHAHHLLFGLIVAFIAGALMFFFTPEPGPFLLFLSALFGFGVALVLDEFALLFHLKDVYWQKEGRKSVDAIILGMVLGTLLLLRVTPFGGIVDNEPGFLVSTAVALNMIAVFIAAAKGKMFMAVIGVFVPFFAIIGAIRLAEPGSMWAHYRYPKNSYKMKHAKLRKKRFEEKWLPRKDKIWDFIGGKPDRPLHHETKPDHL